MLKQGWLGSALFLLAVEILRAHPGVPAEAPPPGRTGSLIFNEPNCTQCHTSFPVNSGLGTLTLAGAPPNYVLGQTYNLTVTLRQNGQRRWGFQLSSRSRTNGAQAGTLQTGADGFTNIETEPDGVQFISHTVNGTRGGTADGPVNFGFSWRAPTTNAGQIVFSLAGNAANNNNSPDGDYIYTLETQSEPASGQTTPTLSSISPSSGPVTGGTPVIISGSGFLAGATVSVGGITASNVTIVSATEINAVTGAVPLPGPVDVVVSNPGGFSGTLTHGFTYTAANLPAPSSNALFLPFVIDTTGFRTNLGMSSLTAHQANVTVQLIDQSGSVLGSKLYVVPANGLRQINGVIADILGTTSPANRFGYLILEADQAISAFATPIDNITQDSSVIQGGRGLATRLLLPTSTSTGLFKTSLTVVNDGNSSNQIELRFRDVNGQVQATKSITVGSYGFFHSEDIHSFLEISGTFGPIEIRSTNATPLPLMAISRVSASLTTSIGTGTTSSFFSAQPYSW